MFLEYQNEIIAFIVFLLLIIIYLLIKLNFQARREYTVKTLNTPHNYDSFNVSEPLLQEEEVELIEENDAIEEGSFRAKEEAVTQNEHRKSDIIIRKVPKHEKITKQHFKEFAGIRILVAEDNLINQKVIAGLLADSGIEITMANDGQEVLDILEKDNNYLMILMDAHMPRINGLEATIIIRENSNYNHIVVVALSGDTAPDDIKKMSEAGMKEYLEKPLRMDSLYDVFYAYSGPVQEKKESDDSYIEVPMTKELHRDKGLAVCGGDESFYFEILNEFIHTYADSAYQLRTLLTSSKEKAAEKLLLDITGVSANIGAETLNKIANSLKEALEDTQEKTYFTILEQYQIHLEILVKDIEEFMTDKS